ncbi:Maf family nucleotide pyrophosphatase [Nafulsella turpanensis]|uniref:Maf family nucleotide pyrophosphatase n=1 Tax=Nafulsella turpanensis TaxID=1265690 RepID=UPI00037C76FB|nr:Maf family nucleotide pyrophosphatase [Nafulsella turpanensis]
MNLLYPLILGSKSPRRQELLRQAGFSFMVESMDTDESYPADLPADAVAAYLAQKKAEAFAPKPGQLLLTADTTVIVDEYILGKPADEKEAVQMLRQLSGRSHRVVSGICLRHPEGSITADDCTEVFFRQLKEEEITFYIRHFKPFDKAGAYGIQEWIGMIGIERIHGSYYTVMGLPLHRVYKELEAFFNPS